MRPEFGNRSVINAHAVGRIGFLFALAAGLCGAVLSLLLRWPGLAFAAPGVKLAAEAHVAVLLFFSVIPALLSGYAVLSVPSAVGARDTAFGAVSLAGSGCIAAGFGTLLVGLVRPFPLDTVVAANLAMLGAVLSCADLAATILNERSVRFRDLRSGVLGVLIAACFGVCAFPMMAAAFSTLVWRGMASDLALRGLLDPAFCIVLLPLLGLADDLVMNRDQMEPARSRVVGWVLAGVALSVFVLWAAGLLHHLRQPLPIPVFLLLIAAMVVPVQVSWIVRLFGGGRRPGSQPVARLFSLGFAVVLPAGLLAQVLSGRGHEAIALAVTFGVFAAFYHSFNLAVGTGLARRLARLQFWFLLPGMLPFLLPGLGGLAVPGAAMLALSVLMFVAVLVLMVTADHVPVIRHLASGQTIADGEGRHR